MPLAVFPATHFYSLSHSTTIHPLKREIARYKWSRILRASYLETEAEPNSERRVLKYLKNFRPWIKSKKGDVDSQLYIIAKVL